MTPPETPTVTPVHAPPRWLARRLVRIREDIGTSSQQSCEHIADGTAGQVQHRAHLRRRLLLCDACAELSKPVVCERCGKRRALASYSVLVGQWTCIFAACLACGRKVGRNG